MVLSISTNLFASKAVNRLNSVASSLGRSIQRLSSGERISRASDDSAGLAVATSLSLQRRVLSRSITNANDAVSLLQVAESAVSALGTIVERTKELATQSASGSLSTSQREALNTEAQALTREYDRIIASTSYNGISILAPTQSSTRFQFGFGASGSVTTDSASQLARAIGIGTYTSSGGQAIATAPSNGEITTGDFDGDGIGDVATFAAGDNKIQVFVGTSAGSLASSPLIISVGATVTSLAAGDLNNDGKADIIAGDSIGRVYTYKHQSNSFTGGLAATASIDGQAAQDLALADFNSDGKLDVAVSVGASIGGVGRILNGSSDIGLTTSTVLAPLNGATGGKITTGDINGDGRADIVATTNSHSSALVLINNSGEGVTNPTFSTSLLAVGGSSADVVLGDLNGDGNDDLITDVLSVNKGWVSNGTTFSQVSDFTMGRDVGLADLNGDGNLDLYGVSGTQIRVAEGVGDGTFAGKYTPTGLGGEGRTQIAFRDQNGDGVPDAITGGVSTLRVDLAQTKLITSLPTIDLSSVEKAQAALTTLESAETKIAAQQGLLGASQRRIESTLSDLRATVENYRAAESRILDIDTAQQTAQLVRRKILQETTTAVLAQANQIPGLALQLLESSKERSK